MSKNYYLGLATCLGLFVPLFGHSVSLFGVHNRLIGLLLLIGAGFGGVLYRKEGITRIWSFGCYLILFLVMMFYSDSSQINNLLSFEFDRTSYYESKLSIVFLFTLIPAIASFILVSVAKTKGFQDGFIMAMLILGVAAIGVSSMYSEYWFTNSYSKRSEWEEVKAFSQIGITVLHLIGALVSLKYILLREYTAAAVILFVLSALFLIVYLQRSSWLYLALVFAYLISRVESEKAMGMYKVVFVLAVISVLGLFVGMKVGVFTDSVGSYASQLSTGGLFDTREWAYRAAWEGFVANPLGNGFGSFSMLGYFRYPHNIVLEALYELGLAGGILVSVFIALSLKALLAILADGRNKGDMELQIIGLLFGYILVVVLKSGDLTSIERMVSMTILFSGIAYGRRKRYERTKRRLNKTKV